MISKILKDFNFDFERFLAEGNPFPQQNESYNCDNTSSTILLMMRSA